MIKVRDYQCKDCNVKFEAFLRGDSKPECPNCHSHNTEYIYGATAFKVGGLGTTDTRMRV